MLTDRKSMRTRVSNQLTDMQTAQIHKFLGTPESKMGYFKQDSINSLYWPELTDADAVACMRKLSIQVRPSMMVDALTGPIRWEASFDSAYIGDQLRYAIEANDPALAVFLKVLEYLEQEKIHNG